MGKKERGRPLGTVKITAEQAIEALKGTGGVKTTIAKRLKVTRQTVDNYLNRWSTFQQAYLDEKASVDDAAVSVVMADIMNNHNVETAKWWIARKLPEFSDTSKVAHSGEITTITRIVENRNNASNRND
jgi:DNA-directed RNA polymerase specialized sigma subunit